VQTQFAPEALADPHIRELEAILRGAVVGLRDGTISTEVAMIHEKEKYDDVVTMTLPNDNAGQPMRAELGVAGALLGPAKNLVSSGERAHAGADRLCHAGEIGSLPRGECRREALMKAALADRDLTGVDPGRPDRHQHLIRPGDGILDLAHLKHIDPTVLVESHCLHVISSLIARSRPYLPRGR